MSFESHSQHTYHLEGMRFLQKTFGYQYINMSDYSITLYIENDEIIKCSLDMLDQDFFDYYN